MGDIGWNLPMKNQGSKRAVTAAQATSTSVLDGVLCYIAAALTRLASDCSTNSSLPCTD